MIYQYGLVFASTAATQNKTDITSKGRNPCSLSPGSADRVLVGRPKKYRAGPDLLMTQETVSVARVESRRTTGNVPEVCEDR